MKRPPIAAFLVASLAACKASPTRATRGPTPSAIVADAAPPTALPVAASLPPVDLGAPGPIRVVGYPAPFDEGQGDRVSFFGYATDGVTYAECSVDQCCAGQSECFIEGPDGKSRSMGDVDNDMHHHPDKKNEIVRFIKEERLLKSGAVLKGTWPFARDVTLHVVSVAGTPSDEAKDGKTRVPFVRIGGAVGTEAPVFVDTLALKACDRPGWYSCREAGVEGMALSGGGAELALIAYSAAAAHTAFHVTERIATAVLAACIYNDTGMRHHEAGRFGQAKDLFARAAAVDPDHPFAAYNLACASARLGGPLTETALRVAIAHAKDPNEVRRRAAKDADFDSVRKEPWFAEVSAPAE